MDTNNLYRDIYNQLSLVIPALACIGPSTLTQSPTQSVQVEVVSKNATHLRARLREATAPLEDESARSSSFLISVNLTRKMAQIEQYEDAGLFIEIIRGQSFVVESSEHLAFNILLRDWLTELAKN